MDIRAVDFVSRTGQAVAVPAVPCGDAWALLAGDDEVGVLPGDLVATRPAGNRLLFDGLLTSRPPAVVVDAAGASTATEVLASFDVDPLPYGDGLMFRAHCDDGGGAVAALHNQGIRTEVLDLVTLDRCRPLSPAVLASSFAVAASNGGASRLLDAVVDGPTADLPGPVRARLLVDPVTDLGAIDALQRLSELATIHALTSRVVRRKGPSILRCSVVVEDGETAALGVGEWKITDREQRLTPARLSTARMLWSSEGSLAGPDAMFMAVLSEVTPVPLRPVLVGFFGSLTTVALSGVALNGGGFLHTGRDRRFCHQPV